MLCDETWYFANVLQVLNKNKCSDAYIVYHNNRTENQNDEISLHL